MLFCDLASFLERLEKTPSRIEITKILAELFKKTSAEEIDITTYLVLGQLAPSYAGIILNIAEKMMLRVLVEAYKTDSSIVISQYKKTGDLGETAQRLAEKNKFNGKSLSIKEVHEKLIKVAQTSGEGSQEKKVKLLSDLIKSSDSLSVKFISRIPVGKLRLGFSDKTILDALSWMEKGDKSLKKDLEKAYQVLPDPGLLAPSQRN